MAVRGHMTNTEHAAKEKYDSVAVGARSDLKQFKKSPTEPPPFTVGQIKRAIPPHCFNRSLIRSFSYVVHDIVISSILFYIALNWIPTIPAPFHYIAWQLYWAAQGCIFTGVWVIAHECGHHAFSDYSLLNDVLGLTLHSALLVPYFSWKYSHKRHHSNTGSLERDENFIPFQKSVVPWYAKSLTTNPVGRLLILSFILILGWPAYLTFNMSGHPYPRFASHFDPKSPIYYDNERVQIFISDVGVVTVAYALYRLAASFGFWWMVRVYGVPLLVVNGFLVLITYLHHTHLSLPHYDSSEWDWLRGALATVDRNYGFLNNVFHNIANTHVAHHLFSTIPHYHAIEATEAIKPILGEYYQFDGTPIYKAMFREVKECVYVEQENGSEGRKTRGVFWFNNKF